MAAQQTHPNERVDVITKPPRIYLAASLIGLLLHAFVPFNILPPNTPLFSGIVLGLLPIAGGLGLMFWSNREFVRHETAVNTDLLPSALVKTGPYRYSRNPMYVALTLLQIGIAFIFNSTAVLLMLIPTLLVMHYGVILREEAYMARHFGEAYALYKAKVRRWL